MGRRSRFETDQAQDYEEHGALQRSRDDGVKLLPPEPDQQVNLGPVSAAVDVAEEPGPSRKPKRCRRSRSP
jgi:hypothetical protein